MDGWMDDGHFGYKRKFRKKEEKPLLAN